MKKLSKTEISAALTSMTEDLKSVKTAAEEFESEIVELDPADLAVDLSDELDEMDYSDEEKDELPKIETVEEAKKVLEEAKKDIQKVCDSIDGLTGQAEEEIEATAFRRQSTAGSKTISTLAAQATNAIDEANAALKYWKFLKLAKKEKVADLEVPNVRNSSLQDTMNTVKEAKSLWSFLNPLFGGNKKEASAVPPTGAKFTGDKFPSKGDASQKELKHWEDGAKKFKSDKKFEDGKPNPAEDNRLNNVDYNRNDAPYVNASFVKVEGNKFGSYWKVSDTKTGKEFVAAFASAPNDLGPKNDVGFEAFASKDYGKKLAAAVQSKGIAATAAHLNAKLNGKLTPVTAGSDSVKSYYANAMGDASYAKDMVADNKPKSDGSKADYKPKDDKVKAADFNTKPGTGKLSSKDPEVIKARARKAVEVARRYASVGSIPFTKVAIHQKASELMTMEDAQFKATEATLLDIPIVNQAALVEAHIPESENGIVGNAATGVRDPKASVATENVNTEVASDAKIAAKTASVVPQTLAAPPQGLQLSDQFTTTESKLQKKGVSLDKIRKPSYRTF